MNNEKQSVTLTLGPGAPGSPLWPLKPCEKKKKSHLLCQHLPLDMFTGGYLLEVPGGQGFLEVQVHLACPEMKTEIVTASCVATLYYHLKTNGVL